MNLENLRGILHELRDADAERGEGLGIARVGQLAGQLAQRPHDRLRHGIAAMKGKGWGQSKVRHPGLFVVGTPEILGDRSHLSPANVSKGRRCAKVRTQNVLLPVNISPWRCSATLRRPSSDLISRLCTAMGDVERREFVSLGGIAGNELSRASGVTPVVHAGGSHGFEIQWMA